MSASYNVQPSERTEIIRGSQNVIDAGLKFISNTKTKLDACVDYTRPALAVDIESISKSLAVIKAKKGIQLTDVMLSQVHTPCTGVFLQKLAQCHAVYKFIAS